LALAAATARPETLRIDTEHSTLTVLVYKTGLFSAFADDHVIRAPIAGGSVSVDAPSAVQLSVRSASLTVLDPGLAPAKRAEVQARMLGPEVLDSGKYPDIAFASTTVESAGSGKWAVTGQLTIHGVARPVTVSVTQLGGRFRGSVMLKQRDFGIKPISIVGGTVKVKDEIKVEFDIVTQP
jgi:polyisoprenoid-binding protein YceI